MKKTLVWKSIAVFALVLVLLTALDMIGGVIRERQRLQQQVEANIAETAAGTQTIVGPVLVVLYKGRVTTQERDKDDKPRTVVNEYDRRVLFFPELLALDGKSSAWARFR